jgi:hypothetical protein
MIHSRVSRIADASVTGGDSFRFGWSSFVVGVSLVAFVNGVGDMCREIRNRSMRTWDAGK